MEGLRERRSVEREGSERREETTEWEGFRGESPGREKDNERERGTRDMRRERGFEGERGRVREQRRVGRQRGGEKHGGLKREEKHLSNIHS